MNQKGFAPILIVLLISVVAGIGGYLVYTNYSNIRTKVTPPPTTQPTTSPTANPAPTGTDETVYTEGTRSANWKKYTNNQYSFEFLYPSELTLEEYTQGGNIQTKSNNRISFHIINDTSSTIAEYLVKADQISQSGWEGQPSRQVQSTKKVIINGLNCIQREEYLIAADLNSVNTYCKRSSIVISITLLPTPGNTLAEDESMYHQILSTFKFLP